MYKEQNNKICLSVIQEEAHQQTSLKQVIMDKNLQRALALWIP